MKLILAIIWTGFIALLFYKEQPYYLQIFFNFKNWLPFAVIFIAVHFLAKKFFLKLSSRAVLPRENYGIHIKFRWLIILAFIFAALLSTLKFYQYDLSRLTEKNIIKDGDQLILTENFPNSDQQLLFSKDEIVSQTSIVKSYLPSEISRYFENLSPLLIFNLLGNIILSAAIILLLIFIFASLGSIFTNDLFLSSGLGMLFISLGSFSLAAGGIFTKSYFLIFLTLALFATFHFWRKFWKSQKFAKLECSLLFTGTAFFLGMALVDIIKVLPFGWDNLNVYSRYEKILAETATFPHGIGSFAWTNLAAAGWLISENIYLSTLMLFTCSILGFFLLYRILRRFHSEKISWALTLIFYTVPFVVNQQFVDLKSDLPLFFIGALAVERFFDYLEKKDKKNLILMGLLLGFAFAIKITAFILIAVIIFAFIFDKQKNWQAPTSLLLIFLSFLGYTKNFAGLKNLQTEEISTAFLLFGIILAGLSIYKKKPQKILREFCILFTFIFLVFSPWAIYNFIDAGEYSPYSFFYGKTESQPVMKEMIEYCKTPYEVVDLDYDRYTGGIKNIADLVKIPWNVNFTPKMDNPITDFSFIFLASIGFFLLFPKKLLDKVFAPIALITGSYFAIWIFVGNGVIWYGIFTFLGMLILLGNIPEKLSQTKWTGRFFIIAAAAVLFSNFLVRTDKFAPPQFFTNTIGAISNEELQDYIFPGYKEVAGIINKSAEEQAGDSNSKERDSNIKQIQLYRVGTFIPYFINLPDSQVRSDHFLEDWICIQTETDETIKKIFAANGFTHILITESADSRIENANYLDAQKKFIEFLDRSGWRVLYKDHGLRLMEII